MNNTCIVCNKPFIPVKRKDRKTCSRKCLTQLRININAKLYGSNIYLCNFCNKEFKRKNKNSKYCSRKCKHSGISERYTGRKITKEWKENQNKKKTVEFIKKEGKYPCPKCNKMFFSNTSLRANKSYCNDVNVGIFVCDICNKLFNRKRSLLAHVEFMHKENDRLEKCAIAASLIPYNVVSKAELNLLYFIKSIFPNAIGSYNKLKPKIYDICVEEFKLFIEFDGDYWHGNPNKFEMNERIIKRNKQDEEKNLFAIKNGFDIIRVWESDSKEFMSDFLENYNAGIEVFKNFIDKKKWHPRNI